MYGSLFSSLRSVADVFGGVSCRTRTIRTASGDVTPLSARMPTQVKVPADQQVRVRHPRGPWAHVGADHIARADQHALLVTGATEVVEFSRAGKMIARGRGESAWCRGEIGAGTGIAGAVLLAGDVEGAGHRFGGAEHVENRRQGAFSGTSTVSIGGIRPLAVVAPSASGWRRSARVRPRWWPSHEWWSARRR